MYKKRIKDWAIDKNVKSDKPPTSPRTRQRRDATQKDSQPSIMGTVVDTQNTSNYANSCPSLAQQSQYGTLPPAGKAVQREYQTPTTMSSPQPRNDDQYWASVDQSQGDRSYSPSLAQNGHYAQQLQTSALLGSIRDRFLEASEAITRRDTARLFEILNPAYEAMSSVAETEPAQLLAVVADLFGLLHRRPDHQDMLRQLLHYVLALVPDAVRQNQFLSCDSQVLTFLGQPGHDPVSSEPLETSYESGSRPTASPRDYNYYGQPSGAGPAFDSSSVEDRRHPY